MTQTKESTLTVDADDIQGIWMRAQNKRLRSAASVRLTPREAIWLCELARKGIEARDFVSEETLRSALYALRSANARDYYDNNHAAILEIEEILGDGGSPLAGAVEKDGNPVTETGGGPTPTVEPSGDVADRVSRRAALNCEPSGKRASKWLKATDVGVEALVKRAEIELALAPKPEGEGGPVIEHTLQPLVRELIDEIVRLVSERDELRQQLKLKDDLHYRVSLEWDKAQSQVSAMREALEPFVEFATECDHDIYELAGCEGFNPKEAIAKARAALQRQEG